MSESHIFSKEFRLQSVTEQKFIILSNQEFLWNTMNDRVQKKVLKMWLLELHQDGLIAYSRTKNKTQVDVIKGKNFHLILSGINASTEHSILECGCEFLYNNLIQQFLLVEPNNECQAHHRTIRKIKDI